MIIRSDWHIHSRHSCDGACLEVTDLAAEAPVCRIEDFGLTDHLHTPYNLPDVAASREAFLADCNTPNAHFGVEVSCVSQWELDEIAAGRCDKPVYGLRTGGQPGCELAIGLTAEMKAAHNIEYVVGGTHWPMYVPYEREAVIRDYHRQNIFLATHPLVDIVAHPWWWMGHWRSDDGRYEGEPWFDDFQVIPATMHDEFADAASSHGSAVEVNIGANLLNPGYPERFVYQYLEYLACLQARGVQLSIGSDCHNAHYRIEFDRAADMLVEAGIKDDFWTLPPRTSAIPAFSPVFRDT